MVETWFADIDWIIFNELGLIYVNDPLMDEYRNELISISHLAFTHNTYQISGNLIADTNTYVRKIRSFNPGLYIVFPLSVLCWKPLMTSLFFALLV